MYLQVFVLFLFSDGVFGSEVNPPESVGVSRLEVVKLRFGNARCPSKPFKIFDFDLF